MYKVPNCPNIILKILGKRQIFADQLGNLLTLGTRSPQPPLLRGAIGNGVLSSMDKLNFYREVIQKILGFQAHHRRQYTNYAVSWIMSDLANRIFEQGNKTRLAKMMIVG